jgi:predicted nuclease of restriction endonuclease-like (RecB) superfamily
METTYIKLSGINDLVHAIQKANQFFLAQTQRQVNASLTLRNWIIGYYLAEYEQKGEDRSEYGERLIRNLSDRLKNAGIKGLSHSNLQLFKQFYNAYPEMVQALQDYSQLIDFNTFGIVQTVSGQSETVKRLSATTLLSRLSFSHFIELIKLNTFPQRVFYETESIVNNWSVRDLQRAINSMLFERTGLNNDKQAVLEKHKKGSGLKPEDVFRNPYMLEFLGLEEKSQHIETDLEQAIIDHLQKFLLEMGRGFCFEARQKRITFDNTHYRIDLVFYHRLLRCHVLIDLKMGKFTPADSGQMHMYLNYFKENEAGEGDNPPIGIILCADKSETLVKYSTSGLANTVFVSKYMTNLPTEKQLQYIISEEREKVGG